MSTYRVKINSINGVERIFDTAFISSSFTPTEEVKEKEFVFPLTGETYNSIAFKLTLSEVFQNASYDTATPLFNNSLDATYQSFDFIEEEPDDWDTLGKHGIKYWQRNDSSPLETYYQIEANSNASQLFPSGGVYRPVTDEFGGLLYFENGVNFYAGYSDTRQYFNRICVWRPSTDFIFNRDTGVLRYGTTELLPYSFDDGYMGIEVNKGVSSITILNGYAGNMYLCEYKYNGKDYLGVLAFGVDEEGIVTGAIFVGAEQVIFGKFDKPVIPEEDKSKSAGGIRGTRDKTSGNIRFNGADGTVIAGILSKSTENGIHVYQASQTQFSNIMTVLYDGSFWGTFKNLVADPLDGMCGAYMLPCKVPQLNTDFVRANGKILEIDGSEVKANRVETTIIDKEYGSVDIKPYYDSFLDYGGKTKLSIYLPFIGYKDLDINKCMDGKINLNYRIDVLTGNILWYLYLTDRFGNEELLYQFMGQCAVQLPFGGAIKNIGTLIGSISGAIPNIAVGIATGNVGSIVQGTLQVGKGVIEGGASTSDDSNVGFGGNSCLLGHLDAYLIITRPVASEPDRMGIERGIPSDITVQIGELPNGFNKVKEITVDDIDGITEKEAAELKSILTSGFYV